MILIDAAKSRPGLAKGGDELARVLTNSSQHSFYRDALDIVAFGQFLHHISYNWKGQYHV